MPLAWPTVHPSASNAQRPTRSQLHPVPTLRLSVDPVLPQIDRVERAAELLRRGGTVAFPTETVYGLGANALDAAAVAKIFAAKGRPSHNPLIVHVADVAAAQGLVADWPPAADRLVRALWPGPLSIVLPKRSHVPDIVTAGGPTIALRIPQHPVALALLRAAGIPIAAPSANRSNYISPTTAEHVARGLADRIDAILDGGPATGGLESTVIHLGVDPPRLLRPGLIPPSEIARILGRPIELPTGAGQGSASPLEASLPPDASSPTVAPSPGMLALHYAPAARIILAAEDGRAEVLAVLTAAQQHPTARIGWLRWEDTPGVARDCVDEVPMPRDPTAFAARWYAVLHELDAAGVATIVVPALPTGDDWLALQDRLRRGSHRA